MSHAPAPLPAARRGASLTTACLELFDDLDRPAPPVRHLASVAPNDPGNGVARPHRAPFVREGRWPASVDPAGSNVVEERCHSLLRANDWVGLRHTLAVNPYRGCTFGCANCTSAAPTVHAKVNAVEKLREALQHPRYQVRPIHLGSASDVYQPIERDLRLTRRLLQLLDDCGHPVIIVTRSPGILRDRDLLQSMARRRLLQVAISLCSLDAELTSVLEPRAALPSVRLDALRRLSQTGIPVGLHLSPLLAGFNDGLHAQNLLQAAAKAGAKFVRWDRTLSGLLADGADGRFEVHRPARAPEPGHEQGVSSLEQFASSIGLQLSGPELDCASFTAPRPVPSRGPIASPYTPQRALF